MLNNGWMKMIVGAPMLLVALLLSIKGASASPPPYSWDDDVRPSETTRLVGLWGTRATIKGEPLILAMLFTPEGRCQMLTLTESGELVGKTIARYTYRGGVLRLAINGRLTYSRLRWQDASHFLVQGETCVWERVDLQNEEDPQVSEYPFNHTGRP